MLNRAVDDGLIGVDVDAQVLAPVVHQAQAVDGGLQSMPKALKPRPASTLIRLLNVATPVPGSIECPAVVGDADQRTGGGPHVGIAVFVTPPAGAPGSPISCEQTFEQLRLVAVPVPDAVFQPTLLDVGAEPSIDPGLGGARRRFLGAGAWVDWTPRWVRGADALFEAVVARAPWAAHERSMYDSMVLEPRLTTGRWDDPPSPVPAMAAVLSARYGLDLDVVAANLYRGGADSVAWHGDRVGRDRATTVVAIVSLGSPRRFLLRPAGGGPSVRFTPGHGDLLVLGGTCQRTFQHCVPKQARAGARISVMFRELGWDERKRPDAAQRTRLRKVAADPNHPQRHATSSPGRAAGRAR